MAASISCVVASRSFKTRRFTACCGHFVLQDPRKQAITLTAAAFTRHAVSPSRGWPCPQKTWTWTNVCRGKSRVRPEEAPEHLSWGEFTSCSGRWWCGCGLRSRTHMGEWESGGFAKLLVWIKSSRCLTAVGSGVTVFWWRGKKNKHLHEKLYRRAFTTTLRYSRDACCKCCVRCLCRLQRQSWSTQNKETVTFLIFAGLPHIRQPSGDGHTYIGQGLWRHLAGVGETRARPYTSTPRRKKNQTSHKH